MTLLYKGPGKDSDLSDQKDEDSYDLSNDQLYEDLTLGLKKANDVLKEELEEMLNQFWSEEQQAYGFNYTQEQINEEIEKLLKQMPKPPGARNYHDQNNETKGLILETPGGAGHKQAAERKAHDLKKNKGFEDRAVEVISVLQEPDSDIDSWMKLGFIDIGKKVIKDWNEKQKKGDMGAITSLAVFQHQVRAGERIFGGHAGKEAFITFTARKNMEEIYDTQNIYTPNIARAVNKYVEIKTDEKKNHHYNHMVRLNDFLRQNPILKVFSSSTYTHEITHDPDFNLKYTKVMTDLPTMGEDFFVSLRLMGKEDFKNFHLEVPHAAPLTDKDYDQQNHINIKETLRELAQKHPEKGFGELLKDIIKSDDEVLDYQDLKDYLQEPQNEDKRRLYDIAYYVMKCPNFIDLELDHYNFTIGPIRPEFVEKHESIQNQEKVQTKKISFERNQVREDAISNKLFLKATGIKFEKNPKEYSMKVEDSQVAAIMLGSQASDKTLDYIDKYIEDARLNGEQDRCLFVLTGNYKDPKPNELESCLYQKVCERIVELKASNQFPENLQVIPLENQGPQMIADTFSIADEVLIRTGGLTSMEVEAVCKDDCRILIHSEVEEDVSKYTKKEDFEKACFKTMLPWEIGNAMHIQATRGDDRVKVVNTTSINKIRETMQTKQQNPLDASLSNDSRSPKP